MEKPYLLFYGFAYYPDGGFADFKGAFATLKEAKNAFHLALTNSEHSWEIPDWGQVVDARLLESVWGQGGSVYHDFDTKS
jgi:hypothetical protein